MVVLDIWSNSSPQILSKLTKRVQKSSHREQLLPCLKLQRVAMCLSWSNRSSNRTRVVIEENVVVQEVTEVRDRLLRQLATRTLSHSLERSRQSCTQLRTTLANHIRTLILWTPLSKGNQATSSLSNTPLRAAPARVESLLLAITLRDNRRQPLMGRATAISKIYSESMRRTTIRARSAITLYHHKCRS